MKNISTFLLFVGEQAGKAEEAVSFYTSLFGHSEVLDIKRYAADENEPEGFVKFARFTLGGVEHKAMDSGLDHQFTFTPAVSLYVECETADELNAAFEKLSENGKVLMPPDNYGFSEKFGWLQDKYGVSWQLNFGALNFAE